jgi:hypothetical protein
MGTLLEELNKFTGKFLVSFKIKLSYFLICLIYI